MPLPKCQFCKRQLTNAKSISDGVGPECADKRAQFFGSIGTSDGEIASLVSSGDETVLHWVKLFGRAIANKDKKYSKIYIEAARREAQTLMPVTA